MPAARQCGLHASWPDGEETVPDTFLALTLFWPARGARWGAALLEFEGRAGYAASVGRRPTREPVTVDRGVLIQEVLKRRGRVRGPRGRGPTARRMRCRRN